MKTDFKMVLLEGNQLVHGDFDVEEKPLLTQFRDPTTYAYQLQQSIRDKTHTKVVTIHHLPNIPIQGGVDLQGSKDSHLRVTKIEDIPQSSSGQPKETGLVSYASDFDRSKVNIIKWSFTDSNSVLVTRRDRSSKVYKNSKELSVLSSKDLLTIQHLTPELGSLTEQQRCTLTTKMTAEIWRILEERKNQQ